MTYILAGALAAAVGLASILGVGMVWLVRKVTSLSEKRVLSAEAAAEAAAETYRWRNHVAQIEQVLKDKGQRFELEVAARKKVEAQRDDAIIRLSKTGDPAAIAAALQRDLDRLQALSEVSDLPPGTIATAPGDNED